MKVLNQPEIPKRSMHCHGRGEQFIPGTEVFSLIREEDPQHLARNDYCSVCWQEIHTDACAKPETRGYWKSKIEPKSIPLPSSRPARALQLLKNLISHPNGHEAEIFVLSLFLAHSRQIALRQEFQEEGNTYQLYEILKHEEFITIKSVKLSQIQIDTLQKSLAQKLN